MSRIRMPEGHRLIVDGQLRFELRDGGRAIRCGFCGRVSWNANDVEQRYCGSCHVQLDLNVPNQVLTELIALGTMKAGMKQAFPEGG
jgi:hypothetical protein